MASKELLPFLAGKQGGHLRGDVSRELLGLALQCPHQPDVLDRHHGLLGEACKDAYLAGRECAQLASPNGNDADWKPVAQKRNAQDGAEAGGTLRFEKPVLRIRQDVVDLNRSSLEEGPLDQRMPARFVNMLFDDLLVFFAAQSVMGRLEILQRLRIESDDVAVVGTAEFDGACDEWQEKPFQVLRRLGYIQET